MTEREKFERLICRCPRDDTVTLVYADWLDEQGNEDDAIRARILRRGVEIRNHDKKDTKAFIALVDAQSKDMREWLFWSGVK